MPNDEHYKILRQGWRVWNEWRKANPDITPDLTRIRLWDDRFYYLDLSKANLAGSDLTRSGFPGCNFSYTNLTNADLSASDFEGVDLNGANLSRAKLIRTDLRNSNLGRTDLTLANLCYSELNGANLDSAILSLTIFGGTDLECVIGLDTCEHKSPSIIDHQTLAKSKNLPLNFLRNCGLTDVIIEYIGSLHNNAIEFYSCFISYSSKDQDFADRIYVDLQNKGVRCWFAPEDLKIGDKIRDRIDESIRLRDKLLLILTEHSIASEWVEHEVESALEEERHKGRTILFPIRLDDAVMESSKAWAALIRRTRHIGDFTEWKDSDSYSKAFERLLRDLKAE
jgi:uncharacterized protein YjbI with pentapeptide repeats